MRYTGITRGVRCLRECVPVTHRVNAPRHRKLGHFPVHPVCRGWNAVLRINANARCEGFGSLGYGAKEASNPTYICSIKTARQPHVMHGIWHAWAKWRTGVGYYSRLLTTRKPKSAARNFGVNPKRSVARLYCGPLSQEPPRSTWLLQLGSCQADPSVGAPW